MKLHERGNCFWEWMDEKGYAVMSDDGSYPRATARCGAIFPKQALIGYMIEYCVENGSNITYYYMTDMAVDEVYKYLVDIVVSSLKKGSQPAKRQKHRPQ